jgi:hypothetical protein
MTTAHDRTLTEALEAMAAEGWTGDFTALEDGVLRCLTCRESFGAANLDADGATRLEGASDPGDMAIVIPGTCPACSTKGTVVVRYGPEAGPADVDLLDAVEREPAMPAEHPADGR